jgi:hypothetical protein
MEPTINSSSAKEKQKRYSFCGFHWNHNPGGSTNGACRHVSISLQVLLAILVIEIAFVHMMVLLACKYVVLVVTTVEEGKFENSFF